MTACLGIAKPANAAQPYPKDQYAKGCLVAEQPQGIKTICFTVVGVLMYQTESVSSFRPVVSVDDWNRIITAIEAYSHNSEYRHLLARLERQAQISGITTQTLRSS